MTSNSATMLYHSRRKHNVRQPRRSPHREDSGPPFGSARPVPFPSLAISINPLVVFPPAVAAQGISNIEKSAVGDL
jgi:hypothetical protein